MSNETVRERYEVEAMIDALMFADAFHVDKQVIAQGGQDHTFASPSTTMEYIKRFLWDARKDFGWAELTKRLCTPITRSGKYKYYSYNQRQLVVEFGLCRQALTKQIIQLKLMEQGIGDDEFIVPFSKDGIAKTYKDILHANAVEEILADMEDGLKNKPSADLVELIEALEHETDEQAQEGPRADS